MNSASLLVLGIHQQTLQSGRQKWGCALEEEGDGRERGGFSRNYHFLAREFIGSLSPPDTVENSFEIPVYPFSCRNDILLSYCENQEQGINSAWNQRQKIKKLISFHLVEEGSGSISLPKRSTSLLRGCTCVIR